MAEFTYAQNKAIANTVAEWDLNKTVKRASEELIELSLALLHLEREKGSVEDVLEEMADVRIVLKHLEYKFGNYQKQLDMKVIKGNGKIKEGEFESTKISVEDQRRLSRMFTKSG